MSTRLFLGIASLSIASLLAPVALADEKSFDLPEAHAVSLSGATSLKLRTGDEQSIVVTASESDLEKLDIGVEDGELYVKSKGRFWGWFSSGGEYKLDVTLKRLDALGLSGAAEADVRGIEAGDFKYSASGASETVLQGACTSLSIHVSGASELDAKDFVCDHVKASGSGASDLIVHATQTLEVRGSGATEVDVYGGPETRNMKTSGASEIHYHDN